MQVRYQTALHPGVYATTRPRGPRRRLRIDCVLKNLAGFKSQNLARCDLDLLTRLRIATRALILLANNKVAKSADFDLLTPFESLFDFLKDNLDDVSRLLLGVPVEA